MSLSVERRLVGEEELAASERVAQVHLELHAVLHRVLHAALEHRVAVPAVPLGPVHRDVGVAQQFLGECRARPAAMPTLAVTVTRVSPCRRRARRRCLSASSRRSATSSGPAASEMSSAITTNSSPPRRPSASSLRTTPARRAATARSSSSPTPWPSVSLIALEVVEVDEQRGDGRLAARRAREHLLDAVEDQRAVRQAGERVVRGEERELLLAARELLVGAFARLLEGLADAQ